MTQLGSTKSAPESVEGGETGAQGQALADTETLDGGRGPCRGTQKRQTQGKRQVKNVGGTKAKEEECLEREGGRSWRSDECDLSGVTGVSERTLDYGGLRRERKMDPVGMCGQFL